MLMTCALLVRLRADKFESLDDGDDGIIAFQLTCFCEVLKEPEIDLGVCGGEGSQLDCLCYC